VHYCPDVQPAGWRSSCPWSVKPTICQVSAPHILPVTSLCQTHFSLLHARDLSGFLASRMFYAAHQMAIIPLALHAQVGLLIIDEIHLLGADRGPILEVIVSRMR
jgi:hypothetical protein